MNSVMLQHPFKKYFLQQQAQCGILPYHFKSVFFRGPMNKENFAKARAKLGKTQKKLSGLLGVSLKAVQSYEQGWRLVPLHIERQVYFLLINQRKKDDQRRKDCWVWKKCELKKGCPAWEFQAGHLCWFLSGNQCECAAEKEWKDTMKVCRECEVLSSLL